MKKDRRWLKSAIAASQDAQIALPRARSLRRKSGGTQSAIKTPPHSAR